MADGARVAAETADGRLTVEERRAVIAEVFRDHAPARTAGMAGHCRPHFWGCICDTYGHGENGHREHLIDMLAIALPPGSQGGGAQ